MSNIPEKISSLPKVKEALQRHETLFIVLEELRKEVKRLELLPTIKESADNFDPVNSLAYYVLNHEFQPEFLEAVPERVVTFDIETTEDEQGTPVFHLAVTIDHKGEVKKWTKGMEKKLIDYLCNHQVITTYNGLHFDFAVLARATQSYRSQELMNKCLDIAKLIDTMSATTSRKLRLWTVTMNLLQQYLPKLPWAEARTSGSELIPQILKVGDPSEIELVWQHCFDDAVATRELYAFLNPSNLTLTYYLQNLLKDVHESIKNSQNEIERTFPFGMEFLEFPNSEEEKKYFLESGGTQEEYELFKRFEEYDHEFLNKLLTKFGLDKTSPRTYGTEE